MQTSPAAFGVAPPRLPSVAAPSRLALAQLRRLVQHPGSANQAAIEALVARCVQPEDHVGAAQRGAALMSALLGRTISEEIIVGPPVAELHSGVYAAVISALQKCLHHAPQASATSLHSASSIFALLPPRAAAAQGLRAVVPQMPATVQTDDLVVTLLGDLCARQSVEAPWVAFVCANLGDYTPQAWEQTRPALQILGSLLCDHNTAPEVVQILMDTPVARRRNAAHVLAALLRDPDVSPLLRRTIARQLSGVDTARIADFVACCCFGFDSASAAAPLAAAVDVVATLSAAQLAFGKQSPSQAKWVANVALAVAGIEHAALRPSVASAMLQPQAQQTWFESGQLGRMAAFLACSPAAQHAELASVMRILTTDQGDIDTAISAMRWVHVQDRLSVAAVLAKWQPLGRTSDALAWGALAHGLSMLAGNERSKTLEKLPWLRREGALQSAIVANVFDILNECDPSERRALLDSAYRLIPGHVSGEQAFDIFDMLQAFSAPQRQVLHKLAQVLGPQSQLLPRIALAATEQRWHLADCMDRLRQNNLVPEDVLGPLSDVEDIFLRELVVSHVLSLEISVSSAQQFQVLSDNLLCMTASRRARVTAAAQRLYTPAVAPRDRLSILFMLDNLGVDLLDEFLFACTQTSPRPTYDFIAHTFAQFQRGVRPRIAAVTDTQNVHLTGVTQRVTSSILALQRMFPRRHRFAAKLADMQACIDTCERDTPADRLTRRIERGHTRTRFDEARLALAGPYSGQGYLPFSTSSEVFALPDRPAIKVRDLAALVWQAIEAYPANAITAPRNDAELQAAKQQMSMSFTMKLADCVEKNVILCYAGKASRILQPLQGHIKDVVIDEIPADDHGPALLPAGDVLATLCSEAFGDNDEPSTAQIHKFIGRAMARAEIQWPGAGPGRREYDKFVADLRKYVDMTFEVALPLDFA